MTDEFAEQVTEEQVPEAGADDLPEVADDDSPERSRVPGPGEPALPGDRFIGVEATGTTVEEQLAGESLDQKLARETDDPAQAGT